MENNDQYFKKIYVFDINPGNDEFTKGLIMGKLSRLIKNISIYQNLVIVSHSSLKVLKKMALDAKITSGFLISDCGARIYQISTKKIIYEKSILRSDVLELVHTIAMIDMLDLISTSKSEYLYSFDPMNIYLLAKAHYIKLNESITYNKIKDIINQDKVYGMMAFQKNILEFNEKYSNFLAVCSDWDITTTRLSESAFLVHNAETNKYNAILKIMELKGINDFQNVYYYGINNADFKCYNSFKNHLISFLSFYDTKEFPTSIRTVSYDVILNELSLSLENSIKSSKIRKNIFLHPNSSLPNTDEKTFNISNINKK